MDAEKIEFNTDAERERADSKPQQYGWEKTE